jgi:hypothetical protein
VTAILISLAVGVLTFGFGMLGLYLHRLLSERHMSTGSKDMIGAIMGLVSLLLALGLGTLVGSAYGFSAAQKANVDYSVRPLARAGSGVPPVWSRNAAAA